MDYKEAWQFLDNLQFFKIKLGLESMTKFLGRLGHPEKKLKFVHVGGTNGKGSVSKTLFTILSRAGFKVGLYTSPHLTSVRERFQINDSYISKAEFSENTKHIIDILAGEQITYFEFTTALALQWFASENVDLAILEVGMGGRLDATNIVSPLTSIITNVSMDHEEYLGDTLTDVAMEKAGIIKSGVPLISGAIDPHARRVIRQRAIEISAPIFELGMDFKMTSQGEEFCYESHHWQIDGINIALHGDYQADNAAIAITALNELKKCGFAISDDNIRQGLQEVRWPGRLEFFSAAYDRSRTAGASREYILDGAHNPAGVMALAGELKKTNKQIIMIWASMADKDFGKCLRLIAPLCEQIIFTRPEENRSATPEQLIAELADFHGEYHAAEPVSAALVKAQGLAGENQLICVAGSLYLVGRVRAILLGELASD